jgi:NAD(P) transhydrogenase subunit alpha
MGSARWSAAPPARSLAGVKVAVARETRDGETRVALVPELVSRLTALGYEVLVEPGAGVQADYPDEEYAAAGAVLDPEAVSRADVVLAVQSLDLGGVLAMRPGAAQISFLPSGDLGLVAVLRDASITAFAMELVPRISRAQSMDALTSQAMVAGYRAAIVATGLLRRFLPLTMTAAGTVQPAEVVVLGAGVAGLQTIATLRRLGATVRAYDVRASSAEEIRSLGAEAIDLGLPPLDGARGYAREMTEKRADRQRELLAPYVADADVLITTASVPGLRAPVLVTAAMVEAMRPGSVVVDIAAEAGGNVEGSRPGEVVRIGSARVWGGANVPGQLPGQASWLYAQNVVNLLTLMTVPGGAGAPALFAPDFADEIVAGCAVTFEGAVVHGPTRALLEGQT